MSAKFYQAIILVAGVLGILLYCLLNVATRLQLFGVLTREEELKAEVDTFVGGGHSAFSLHGDSSIAMVFSDSEGRPQMSYFDLDGLSSAIRFGIL